MEMVDSVDDLNSSRSIQDYSHFLNFEMLDSMWKVLMKEVHLGEPTSFLDHVYFGLYSTRMQNKQRYC